MRFDVNYWKRNNIPEALAFPLVFPLWRFHTRWGCSEHAGEYITRRWQMWGMLIFAKGMRDDKLRNRSKLDDIVWNAEFALCTLHVYFYILMQGLNIVTEYLQRKLPIRVVAESYSCITASHTRTGCCGHRCPWHTHRFTGRCYHDSMPSEPGASVHQCTCPQI